MLWLKDQESKQVKRQGMMAGKEAAGKPAASKGR